MLKLVVKLKDKYFLYLKTTPLWRQELDNFELSFLLSLILGNLLLWGVDGNGTFKLGWFGEAVSWLLSEKAIIFSVFFLLPTFLFTLLKMGLFQIPISPWTNIISQFISGIFYSFGCGILMVFLASLRYGYDFNLMFLLFGMASNLCGYGLYIILQAAIQRTWTPTS